MAFSTAVTNFIRSVKRQAWDGVLSIHSLCCFCSTSEIDFLTIDLIVDCIFFKISTKYTSTFPISAKGVSNGIFSTPVLVIISVAVGLRFGLDLSSLSCISSFSIAIMIFDMCLLIERGELPLDKTSKRSTLDMK